MEFLLSSLSKLYEHLRGQKSNSAAQGVDVIIFVIGPTGVGKSTFINTVRGSQDAKVGHGLSTCTVEFEAHQTKVPQDSPVYPGKSLLLIDTPGFDETLMYDSTRVFKGIGQWLDKYEQRNQDGRPPVLGYIYLQDISQKRINNRQNVDFYRLEQLFESRSSRLALVTYRWPPVPPPPAPPPPPPRPDPAKDFYKLPGAAPLAYQQAIDREEELRTRFWSALLDKGARMVKVGDGDDPMKAIREIMNAPDSTAPSLGKD